MEKRTFFDRCFKNSQDRIVLLQVPNLPLALGLFFLSLDFIFLNSVDSFAFYQLGKVFLFVWSYLEVSSGVNYFRKFMGVIVMAILILSFI